MPVIFDFYRCIDSDRDWHVSRLSTRSVDDKRGILLGLKVGVESHHIEGFITL